MTFYCLYQKRKEQKDEYQAALIEGNTIIDEWGQDIHKSELICKEMLKYVKAQVYDQPLIVFLDIDGVFNIDQPDKAVQTLLPSAGNNICDLIRWFLLMT